MENGIGRIEPLTSLRFFAAAYVVFYHTWPAVLGSRPDLFGFGYISVSFFFTLSGYILAVVYLRRERRFDTRQFYVARFARIYPLFFATLIFGTPQLLMARMEKYGAGVAMVKTALTFFGNMVMLQAWILQLFGIDNPNWSLAVETVFYVLFPFVGVYVWRTFSNLGRATAGFVTIYLVAMAIVYLCNSSTLSLDVVTFNPLLHLSVFFCGILIARIQLCMQETTRSFIRRHAILMALACFALFLAITRLNLPMALLNDGLLVPLFAGVLLTFSAGNRAIEAMFSRPWLVLLGESSYAVYLIHFPLRDYFVLAGWLHSLLSYVAFLATVLALSIASYKFLEAPARRAINRFFAEPVGVEMKPRVAVAQAGLADLDLTSRKSV